MKEFAKRQIQKHITNKRHALYEARVASQTVPYDVWVQGEIKKQYEVLSRTQMAAGEKEMAVKENAMTASHNESKTATISVWSFDQVETSGQFIQMLDACEAEFVLFTADRGCLVEQAVELLEYYLDQNPDFQIGYADETDYLKPKWSPDLLQSFFYFGNVYIIRKNQLEKIKSKISKTDYCGKVLLYHILLCSIDEVQKAREIPMILYDPGKKNRCGDFESESDDKNQIKPEQGDFSTDWGYEPVYDEVKASHLYSDFHGLCNDRHGLNRDKCSESRGKGKVSVIIPSKDNPTVLSHCIHSLLEVTSFEGWGQSADDQNVENYSKNRLEIIVVDNGSSLENRQKIERMQSQLKQENSFLYEYHPMPFNFSKMCNLGASVATGDYLLFLNDDIEVVKEDWLAKMVSRASKEYVGAVGAKLLYPDGEKIQHLGITSIHLGPAHKLQFASDQTEHYHRYNRSAVNVLAVTGACLMMRRELFEQIGGFDEKLQVAFNDVELCFAAQKLGYYNVCCNDTFLYHHESLSRGYDAGIEKIKRLHEERDYLYGKYPEYWNHDPYYNRLLVSDILDKGFEAKNRYSSLLGADETSGQTEKQDAGTPKEGFTTPVFMTAEIPEEWYNECLYMGVEFAGDEKQWFTGISGEGDYYIQGWSYAVNVDNSRYQKTIVLKNMETAETFQLAVRERYRPDMEENLPYINHPALCGVEARIQQGALSAGTYLIGYLWEDTASRQKLLGYTGETLFVR